MVDAFHFTSWYFNKPNLFYVEESLSYISRLMANDLIAI